MGGVNWYYMAKKSSKSTRRAKSKKEQAPHKKLETQKTPITPEAPVIIAEGSDEPVALETSKVTKSKKSSVKSKEPSKTAADIADDTAVMEDVVAEMAVVPSRRRMLISAAVLGVIVLALIVGAGIMRTREQSASETTPAGQTSGTADDILQSGGRMCTNQQTVRDDSGSSNPQSVGMMLQSNPTSTLQTPQTFGGGGNEAAALQGAACF
jgi:hypothetical protein